MAYPKIPPFTLYPSNPSIARAPYLEDRSLRRHNKINQMRSQSPPLSIASSVPKQRRKQIHDVLISKFRSKFNVFSFPEFDQFIFKEVD